MSRAGSQEVKDAFTGIEDHKLLLVFIGYPQNIFYEEERREKEADPFTRPDPPFMFHALFPSLCFDHSYVPLAC